MADVTKELIERVYSFCDKLDNWELGATDFNVSTHEETRDLAWADYLSYLLYLLAVDGEVDGDEVEKVNYYLDMNVDSDSLIHTYKTTSLGEGQIPLICKLFVAADNALYNDYDNPLDDFKLVGLFYTSYSLLGKEFILDDELTRDEMEAYESFMSQMKSYMEENIEFDYTFKVV